MRASRFLTVQQVVLLHEHLIRDIGGLAGLRSYHLLDSSVHQPQATYAGEFLYPTLFDQAAAYLLHLTANHPFVDGNKRTAWFACRTFLRINGYSLKPRRRKVLATIEAIASGEQRDWREISEWLAAESHLVG